MRKPPAKVIGEVEKLLREQAVLRIPVLTIKELCNRTGLHRNSVRIYLDRFASEVQTHNAMQTGEAAKSEE